jgi:signal peptidase I
MAFTLRRPFSRRTDDTGTVVTNGTSTNGSSRKPRKRKPIWREWLDAGLFAIIAATIIRMFLVEAYTIPTGSMEGSLLVNDFLFVSKLSYGPRMPNTPLALPLIHNSIGGGKSYSDAVQWDYKRLRTGSVKRNDVVVFNFPNGDTVIKEFPDQDYYQFVRGEGWQGVRDRYTVITHPVDKKENYIKRCVGVPGDKLEVRNGLLFINDKQAPLFPHQKSSYVLRTSGTGLSQDFVEENNIEVQQQLGADYLVNLANDQVPLVRAIQGMTLEPNVQAAGTVSADPREWAYPYDTTNFKWNRDNYGPVLLPRRGATVQLTPQNIALYRRIIRNYEGNTLQENGSQFLINGKPATLYTFKQDYYWMMGDNRHNSLDSRYWGFVPEDHVVGKAWFVWLSYGEGGLRWSRLFRGIKTLEK